MNLNNLNLVELSTQELISTDGGNKGKPSLFEILDYISDHWTEIKKGIYDGWNKQ